MILLPFPMGKFDPGDWYVIIFLCVQFWIRLAVVSYRGKKVRIVASPVVRLVNNSRDRQTCVRNKPECASCVIFDTRLYYKALKLIVCDLIWQINYNYSRLDDGHFDVTGRRIYHCWSRPVIIVTTHQNSVIMWSFKGPKLFAFCTTYWEKAWWATHYIVVYKLILISNLSRIFDWSVHSRSYFLYSTGTFAVSTDSHCAGRRGLNLLTVVVPVELAHWLKAWSRLADPYTNLLYWGLRLIARPSWYF